MTDERETRPPITRILFVCRGNTCRSVMAEAFARRRFGDTVHVESAGIRPQRPEDAQNAIDALNTFYDINVSGHVPRSVNALDLEAFDVIVAMDKSVAKELPPVDPTKVICWKIDDPWRGDPAEYQQSARQILKALGTLPIAGSPRAPGAT